ncbi:ribose ABC transporter permease [Clostridia bacterium]|nr:ribose ABC transporter permease [Clostridia bacterium]
MITNNESILSNTNPVKKASGIERYKSYLPAAIIIVVLFVLGQILSPGFASARNVSNIFAQASILALVAISQSLVIFVGEFGIDLSVGAIMSMSAMLMPFYTQGQASALPMAIFMVVLIGGLAGFINGTGVQIIKIPALAITLVMATVVDGFTLAFTKGLPSKALPEVLKTVGQPLFGQVRTCIIIAVVIIVIFQLVLSYSRYGKSVFLLGSNRNAAKLTGLRVNSTVIIAFTIAGMMAAFAGVIMVGYVGSSNLRMGDSYTLMSVAAVVIGGAKLSGGSGTLLGAALGSIVLILLTSVLIAAGLSTGIRTFLQGLILVMILLFNSRAPKLRV